MSIKATLTSTYKKVNQVSGRNETRFVWELTGAPSEIERYATEQGENARKNESTGKYLFFNKQFPGVKVTELERVVLENGTVIYRVNMLEKTLQIESAKVNEIARLEAYLDVYGVAPAGQPQMIRPTAQPTVATPAAETMEPTVIEGQEALGEAM